MQSWKLKNIIYINIYIKVCSSIYYAIYKALVFCATMTTQYIVYLLCICSVTAYVLQANSAGNCSGIRAGWAIQWRGEYENEDNSHPL